MFLPWKNTCKHAQIIIFPVAYLVMHGTAHELIYLGILDTSTDINMLGAIFMAAILATGGLGLYDTMIHAKQEENLSLIVGVLVPIIFTAMFWFYFHKGVFMCCHMSTL
jgi:hypothetical protein